MQYTIKSSTGLYIISQPVSNIMGLISTTTVEFDGKNKNYLWLIDDESLKNNAIIESITCVAFMQKWAINPQYTYHDTSGTNRIISLSSGTPLRMLAAPAEQASTYNLVTVEGTNSVGIKINPKSDVPCLTALPTPLDHAAEVWSITPVS